MRGLVLVLAAAATPVAAALAGAAGQPGGGGRIVFASERAPNLIVDELLAVAPVAKAPPALVARMPRGAVPDPIARRIASATYDRATGGGRLVVSAANGSSPRVVATSPYAIEEPVWSPDGSSIAFEISDSSPCGPGDHGCANAQLWVVGADGTRLRKVSDRARYPVWSPDGKRLAFRGQYTYYDDAGLLWVAGSDGAGARRLSGLYDVSAIGWAPKGDRIAFARRGVVRVVPSRGGRSRAIGPGLDLAWSSDGRALAVVRADGQSGQSLWLVRPSGRVLRRIAVAASCPVVAASPRRARGA
jgi:hypothetical protein